MDIADITILAIVAASVIVVPVLGCALNGAGEEREDDLRAED